MVELGQGQLLILGLLVLTLIVVTKRLKHMSYSPGVFGHYQTASGTLPPPFGLQYGKPYCRPNGVNEIADLFMEIQSQLLR